MARRGNFGFEKRQKELKKKKKKEEKLERKRLKKAGNTEDNLESAGEEPEGTADPAEPDAEKDDGGGR